MLTQLRPLNSTTVTLDNHPNGIGVLLAGNLIGNIEIDPVWGLTGTMHDTAMALGLVNRDECFTVQNQVFSTVEQATAQVIGAYLASTATWEMPEYIWSAESPNVKDGTIQQTLNFRICYDVIFLGRQATPYFLPLPLPLPANEQQANLLLPMKVKPVANKLFPSPTIPSVPSLPVVAATPTPSFTKHSASMIGSDKVALFGSATKNSYSPSLNIYSDSAKFLSTNLYPV